MFFENVAAELDERHHVQKIGLGDGSQRDIQRVRTINQTIHRGSISDLRIARGFKILIRTLD